MNYDRSMRLAIEVASQNPKAPFGSVLLNNETEEVVETGVNQSSLNPLFHGEIVAINNYANSGAEQWDKLTLVTTAEPCCMCQAAVIWAGIPRVIFGTSIKTLTELGWRQFQLTAQQVADAAKFLDTQLVGGVLEEECDQLFRRTIDR